MPNRTIYVTDADMPIFERAQALAGDNLSATIAQALRRFVEAEDARNASFEEVTVKVGKVAHTYKTFWGKLLAKGRVRAAKGRHVRYEVYQTRKGKLALYTRSGLDWGDPEAWSRHWSGKNWDVDVDVDVDVNVDPHRKEWSYRHWSGKNWDWSQWPNKDSECRLEVYENLDELKGNVPQDFFEAVQQALQVGPDGSEFLDI